MYIQKQNQLQVYQMKFGKINELKPGIQAVTKSRTERKRRRNGPEIAQEGPELAQDPDPFHHMEDQDIDRKRKGKEKRGIGVDHDLRVGDPEEIRRKYQEDQVEKSKS